MPLLFNLHNKPLCQTLYSLKSALDKSNKTPPTSNKQSGKLASELEKNHQKAEILSRCLQQHQELPNKIPSRSRQEPPKIHNCGFQQQYPSFNKHSIFSLLQFSLFLKINQFCLPFIKIVMKLFGKTVLTCLTCNETVW